MPDSPVRLPSTSQRRGQPTWLKLIQRVGSAPAAFAFEGVFLKPGALIPQSGLRPAPDWPWPALLLEYAGCDSTPGTGHRRHRDADLWLLWEFDGAWREMARTTATHGTWVADLAPVARRVLAGRRAANSRSSAIDAVARLRVAIDAEMDALADCDRVAALTALHDALAVRVCAVLSRVA